MIYPWQEETWQRLVQYLENGRLAHAILVSGPSAIGKMEFCLNYIQRMYCPAPRENQQPCGVCENCRLIKAGTHPDVRLVETAEVSGKAEPIKVDEIRKISQFISLSCRQGAYKSVCINKADRMNINAANALLKTLEEPPPGSVLFLVSDRADRLPATVRSRCQTWKCPIPDAGQALAWLQSRADSPAWKSLLDAAGGKPLLAWEMHDSGLDKVRAEVFRHWVELLQDKKSVTETSAKIQNESIERVNFWLQAWCADLIRCHFDKNSDTIENEDFLEELTRLSERTDLHSLLNCMDRLAAHRRIAETTLNRRLQIEDLLLYFRQSLKYEIR